MSPLVLSIFPGGGLLDHAFSEYFTVVRGPDKLWGGDIRTFHPPAGCWDGVLGADPCQAHTGLANLLRAKGLEPRFGDLTSEFERVVEAAQPAWFLRENSRNAPDVAPEGYDVSSFLLDNSTLDIGDGTGPEQRRIRRFWFGVKSGQAPELRRYMDFALFVLPDTEPAVCADPRAVPVARGGSGKVKRTRKPTVTGRHHSNEMSDATGWSRKEEKRSLGEMLRLQGFPEDWLDHAPFTMEAKRKIVGNGVPLPMGRQLARAIRTAIYEEAA
jgi:DNA (cytosine-5)-methyltransferase 1